MSPKRPRGLTPEQATYLQARGFERISGTPPDDESYPFLTLREPQRGMFESEIRYEISPSTYLCFGINICYPSTRREDYLKDLIERGISDFGLVDSQIVPEGEPIRIFVMDNAWDCVVQNLLDRYPTSTQN